MHNNQCLHYNKNKTVNIPIIEKSSINFKQINFIKTLSFYIMHFNETNIGYFWVTNLSNQPQQYFFLKTKSEYIKPEARITKNSTSYAQFWSPINTQVVWYEI